MNIGSKLRGHVIIRNKLQDENLDAYADVDPGENNIIQSAQILLKAKLHKVELVK